MAKQEDINLPEIHDVLIDVARQAGDMITGATPVVEGAGEKMNCKLLKSNPVKSWRTEKKSRNGGGVSE